MHLNDYTLKAMRTNKQRKPIEYYLMQLTNEAAEVMNPFIKGIYHNHDIDMEKIKLELGDCLWYIAALCDSLGFTLEDVAQANIRKLEQRYPYGYTDEDSINRRT